MSDKIIVALISAGGVTLGAIISAIIGLLNARIENNRRKNEVLEKGFEVKREQLGKIYEELLSILNTFPKVSPTDILKNIEFPPCYSMESFESVIEILNYQINDGKEKLDSEMVSQKEKRDIKSDIEKRKYCIEQIKKNQEDYFKAKEAYCLFKQSDKMIIDMYAGQSVRNCLVEFEVVLHNAFISGHSVGDAYDSSKNLIEVTRNKIVNAIRNDIGTIR